LGATGGFLGELASEAQERSQRQHAEDYAANVQLRERKADELEAAIQNMQARGSLQPNQPGYLSPDELRFQLGEAQKQLTGLYKPEEAKKLFERLKKITTGTSTTPPIKVGDVTIPGRSQQITLRPGMTLEDILSSGTPVPGSAGTPQGVAWKTVGKPFRDPADGKWYTIQQDEQGTLRRAELPGYTEETRRQELIRLGYTEAEAEKIMRIEGGLEAKPVPSHKGFKYDPQTDEVVNQDTQDRYTRDDLNKAETPEVVARMFAGQTKVAKEKERISDKKFNQRLQAQTHAFQLALQKGDHDKAKKIIDTSRADLIAGRKRMKTMDKNKVDALNGNQQAMLSLVANHIGMTLGAQRGARITRAVWDEAMESAPWLEVKIAKFFHKDADGNYIFDGWKTGVTLTAEQINQMVDLAHQQVDSLQEQVNDTKQEFDEDIGRKSVAPKTPPSAAAAPPPAEPTMTPLEKQILDKLKGK
jgi:hypothetical protein